MKRFPVQARDVLHIGADDRHDTAHVACTVGELLEAFGYVVAGPEAPVELWVGSGAMYRRWRE